MIVLVQENPQEYESVTLIVDLDRLDRGNPCHQQYYDSIQQAIADPNGLAEVPAEASFSHSGIGAEVLVDPPIHIDYKVILDIE